MPRILSRPACLFALLLSVATAIVGCFPSHPQSTFDAAGQVAEEQKMLFVIIFWAAAIVFVVVEGILIYSIIRFRHRAGDGMPTQTHGNTRLEITWTIIPALVLLVVAIPTIRTIYSTYEPPSDTKNPLNVTVVGHQWWFEFRYPDLEIVTANELHIPTGRVVKLLLESDDVIHSFWVPKLAGKVDLVPSNVNQMWLQADRPGEYFGQCAEFCGIAHALMRFRVYAHEPEKFGEWAAGMHVPPRADTSAAPGRSHFIANCSMCHSTDSHRPGGYDSEISIQAGRKQAWLENPEAANVIKAPNLTHFGIRKSIGAGLLDNTRENLIKWITDPDSVKRGTRMKEVAAAYKGKSIQLSQDQVAQVADYLLSLSPDEASRAQSAPATIGNRGESLFNNEGCSACHSVGTDRIVGPGLAGIAARAAGRKPSLSADEYLRESIVEPSVFVVDGYDNLMPASFARLEGDDLSSLINYLKTLE